MHIHKLDATKKLRFLDLQTDTLKKSKIRYEITDAEVGNIPPETKVYEAVGRMFVLSSVPELRTELQQKTAKCSELIEQCDKNKEFLIKNLKEQEESLRELVKHKQVAK